MYFLITHRIHTFRQKINIIAYCNDVKCISYDIVLGLEMLLLKQVASENTLGQGLTLLTIQWNQTDLGGWRYPSPVKFKV